MSKVLILNVLLNYQGRNYEARIELFFIFMAVLWMIWIELYSYLNTVNISAA